ncbi:hypothetical protein JL722_2162 [Aureococcus anophagefferens]|nr:hypothetical protein JL722_2162 [Aureococcus anophagefferens]
MKAAILLAAGASACFDNDWLINVSGSVENAASCPGSTDGEVCAPDGSSNYHSWSGTYDASTGKFTGTMTTNLCANDHWGLYEGDTSRRPRPSLASRARRHPRSLRFMPYANHTARCTEQTFPAPDYASDPPHAAPLRGRVGMTLNGVNIYGPEEAGFGVGMNPEPCADGSGSCWAGVDVPTCEFSLDITCNGTENVNHGLMLDTRAVAVDHYHNDMGCDYDHTVQAHSPLIGVSLDGYGVYGLYEGFEDGNQTRPDERARGVSQVARFGKDIRPRRSLDACNGHTHGVPANSTYGVDEGTVYAGVFQGDVQDALPGRRRLGPAEHGQCDKEILPIYTPEVPEGYCYDTDCPKISECACYDRCDTVSSGCKHTCDVLVNQMGYNCSELYAPGMKYEGWCDKTCGYAKCA